LKEDEMAEKKIVISGNLILEILRNLNEDRRIRVEGIPEDATVNYASYDEESGGRLTLYVETKAEIKGSSIDVTVHTCDMMVVKEALEKIVENEAPFKRDPLEFAKSVIVRHVELAESALAVFKED